MSWALRRLEDPLPLPAFLVLGPPPVDGAPVGVLRSVHQASTGRIVHMGDGAAVIARQASSVSLGGPERRVEIYPLQFAVLYAVLMAVVRLAGGR